MTVDIEENGGGHEVLIENYESNKLVDKDHIATPRWVVEQIYDLIDIKSFKMCWFPFDHYDSEFKLKADELKLQYKATHKFDDLGDDFFTTEPPENCDLMISNPPFSIQNKIIQRSFELIDEGKIQSFALLLPLSTLETPARAEMWEKHADKLSLIVFKKRIKFLGCKGTFNTACCWVLYNIPSISNKLNWI